MQFEQHQVSPAACTRHLLSVWYFAGVCAACLHRFPLTAAGRSVVRLGERLVDYDPNFKLYMACRLANPHYLPEAYIRVNLVDFTVTRQVRVLVQQMTWQRCV